MDRGSFKALLGAVLLAASFGALAQKTTLTVYTALETDQLKAYEAGFNKVHPNIEIKWVRYSSGVITPENNFAPTSPFNIFPSALDATPS